MPFLRLLAVALSWLATAACGDTQPGTGCSEPQIRVTLPIGAQESLLSYVMTLCRNDYCHTVSVAELDRTSTVDRWFGCVEVPEWGPEAALCISTSRRESEGTADFWITWELSKEERAAGDTYVTTIRKAGTEEASFTDTAASKCSGFTHPLPEPAE